MLKMINFGYIGLSKIDHKINFTCFYFIYLFFSFIFISWRPVTSQHFGGFCRTLKMCESVYMAESAMELHVFPIPILHPIVYNFHSPTPILLPPHL